MGIKLSPRETELYRRCEEILHYIWDPIGVAGVPAARKEYHSYVPQVFALVRDRAEPKTIENYLAGIEERQMGQKANFERDLAVVKILLEWREWIWENVQHVEEGDH
jgi:hypothetical protein